MCGRFAFFSPAEAVAGYFGVDCPLALKPHYNVTPGQAIVTLHHDEADDSAAFVRMGWGLVPSWAKDPSIGNRMINARAETIADKPSFRGPFRRRRCAIIADGFYEWQQSERGKLPYFISRRDGHPLAFAGLWDRWSKEDVTLETCTIITTAANSFLRPLHHRMPAVLSRYAMNEWITAAGHPRDALLGLLGPSDDGLLEYREVSRMVNNPANDGPDLIRPQ